ncbi:hypothetical protein D3C73_865130 [compost metagenome]
MRPALDDPGFVVGVDDLAGGPALERLQGGAHVLQVMDVDVFQLTAGGHQRDQGGNAVDQRAQVGLERRWGRLVMLVDVGADPAPLLQVAGGIRHRTHTQDKEPVGTVGTAQACAQVTRLAAFDDRRPSP